MRIFTKKSVIQKIMLLLVALILFNFIVPNYIMADDETDRNDSDFGGVLLEPIKHLFTALGDIGMGVIQYMMTGSDRVVLQGEGDSDWGAAVKKWFVAAACAVVGGAIIYVTGGLLAPMGIAIISHAAGAVAVGATIGTSLMTVSYIADGVEYVSGDIDVPVIEYSPQEIFANMIPGLDINFINPSIEKRVVKDPQTGKVVTDDDGEAVIRNSSAELLRSTISSWYITLRNIALVGLLSILVYIGIRIIISSTAAEKAKYKQNIMDWLVAMCLLFVLHYIMSFTLTMTESVTRMLQTENKYVNIQLPNNGEVEVDGQKASHIAVNLIGLARFEVNRADNLMSFGYLILYLIMVVYTWMFTFIYLKRVIYMAFLTLIAPLVALTYPIDKIKDGKAQAFDMWLKEYMFNALIQPFHLLIYTILVGSAMEFVKENLLYAIVAIGFMIPAEKFLRKMFGFERAGTVGALSGATAGALIASTFGKFGHKTPSKSSIGGGSSKEDSKVRTKDSGLDSPYASFSGQDTTSNTEGANSQNSDKWRQDLSEQEEQRRNDLINTRDTYQDLIDDPSTGNFDKQEYTNWRNETNEDLDKYRDKKILEETQQRNLRQANSVVSSNKSNRSIIRGFKAIGSDYTRRFTNKSWGAGLAKGAVHLGTRGLGMIAGATAGLVAGTVTGDFSNVAKYGAAGIAVGNKMGSNLANSAISTVSSAASTFKEGYYGEDYENYRNSKLDDEFLKNKDAIQAYKTEFGAQDYKKKMEEAIKFRQHGITDDKKIIKAMKLKDSKGNDTYSLQQKIDAARLEKQIDNSTYNDLEQRKKIQKSMSDKLIANKVNKDVAEQRANDMIRMIGDIKGINF